jgi:hypothetical protein
MSPSAVRGWGVSVRGLWFVRGVGCRDIGMAYGGHQACSRPMEAALHRRTRWGVSVLMEAALRRQRRMVRGCKGWSLG